MIDNDAGDLISDKRKWAKTLRENKAAVRQAIATDNPDKAVEAIWRYMLRLSSQLRAEEALPLLESASRVRTIRTNNVLQKTRVCKLTTMR